MRSAIDGEIVRDVVKNLTDAASRKFVPGPKRRRIRDAAARSLFLVVELSGHKA